MITAPPSVMPALMLTVRMLRPFPGSSGHQIEQMPVANPATATAGISIHDAICGFGLASVMTPSNARPTATASGAMTSAMNPHGGQETTLLTMMLPLLHHGMLLVGLPYTSEALHRTTTGGSPYGASQVSGGRQGELSADERELAQLLGRRLATAALALKPARL